MSNNEFRLEFTAKHVFDTLGEAEELLKRLEESVLPDTNITAQVVKRDWRLQLSDVYNSDISKYTDEEEANAKD